MRPMADDAQVVPFEERHRPSVMALWERYFGAWSRGQLAARWSWQFERNPYAAGRAPMRLLGVNGGRVVGFMGAIPLPLRLGARVHVATAAVGIVVEESERWLGFRM